ncbi:hypothetical protein NQ314_005044 [Rhamnusium bicolor]|uniref:Uncharacterized protein n=1 Tax=Rhamnusium bicolor TaxID=1586634 RepID=A0AAV8ZKR2_9CUCU|nr:hypothetical protein NQ314_005044 [Rhamnusium bicolor]
MPGPRKSPKTCAPFGVATKRFVKVGFHPELDISGAMKREITKVGPGGYEPEFPKCKSKRGMCWRTKWETEEFSKFLGYRNANILEERAFFKSLRGPGTNDIDEGYYKKVDFSVLQDTGFATSKRFQVKESVIVPPPDTYFRNLAKTSTMAKHQFSNVPSFEWDGFIDRLRSREPTYTLPVNRYNIKDGKGTANILNKVVSLRGPYDLFTGPRDGTTIKNYFSPPAFKVPEYSYIKPSDVDVLLTHSSKQRYGRFLKAQRFPKKPTIRCILNDISLCYRNPSDPGPDHYDVSRIKSIIGKDESMYPFDKSQVNARPPTVWKISPGPGRFNPKPIKCIRSKDLLGYFYLKLREKYSIL